MKNNSLLILIILCISFIFLNSFMNADQSKEESGRIVKAIEKVVNTLYKDNTPEKVTRFLKTTFNNILRDLAHFLEFLILGILTMLYSYRFKSTVFKRVSLVLFFCILIALIDEIIQFFSPGRAMELYDLLLDSSGSIIGIILILLLHKIKEKRKCRGIPK
ncbi:VanZ family protein [Actinomycetota bacterium]